VVASAVDIRARNTRSLFFRGLPDGWEDDPKHLAAGQRERMLEAMCRAVAAKGYAKVTVADVVGQANVSRSTFYEQFTDKEDCFLQAYEEGAGKIIREVGVTVVQSGAEDWHERIRIGMTRYLEVLAADPDLARSLLVDVLGAGPKAVALRRKVFSNFVDLYRPAARSDSPADVALRSVPEPFFRALVGGISELVQEHIVTEGAESLPELTDTLIQLGFAIVDVGRASG
jgi:AcrR family transcriptional regulator